jgi:hypothetical protein
MGININMGSGKTNGNCGEEFSENNLEDKFYSYWRRKPFKTPDDKARFSLGYKRRLSDLKGPYTKLQSNDNS